MASGWLRRLSHAFQTFERAVDVILGRGFPPAGLCVIERNHVVNQVQAPNLPSRSLKDILNDAFLWAVPKKRRSLEKRLNRRYGLPEYNWKPHVPKTNLLMCRKCGHDYEAHTLCGYCYEIVKKETEQMQEAIQTELGLSPVEQEVLVLYEGEKERLKDEFWKKQRIIELPKKRPEWFNQNLLQPTTKESSDETNLKPVDAPLSAIKE
ncbi:PREDICTED: 39S ribosomal protein L32, mitochondrial [Dufourea novaeangliae]|uniref:Large ribosomal subunit protein bL32m n=1 Tax=Dufourea novaeangliae TaxID=178035 RepID=A0A154P267_DUFNO|nr:PREDICTED: 39S ribosomal protein L32, mitochondrial [Dufourea novaeangliae]XP_015439374.1 PREDICTED: 39S ribosomal protein L32, mitochondrial [Dufourea novaeangliae]KZC05957.1 39S ribosomal protein L32, mitochondrial [Dufourea novaeangliae]